MTTSPRDINPSTKPEITPVVSVFWIIIERHEPRGEVAYMSAFEEAEGQVDEVPEEAHFPLQRQRRAGGHDRPGTDEIDQRPEAEDQAEAERHEDEEVSIVDDDHLVENELKGERRRDDQGLEKQRHSEDLRRGRGGIRRCCATRSKMRISRPLGLPFEAVAGPRLHHDAGEATGNLLVRHDSAPERRIVYRHPASADAGQDDEMRVVPMKDTWQAQLS